MSLIVKYLLSFLLILNISLAGDYWIKANGPYGGTVNSITALNSGIILASTDDGIFQSTDKGMNWSIFGLDGSLINSIVQTNNGNIWANGPEGVYLTVTNGLTWNLKSKDTIENGRLIIAKNAGIIYADGSLNQSNNALYISTNSGQSWQKRDNNSLKLCSFILNMGNGIIAGYENNGIFTSTDNGISWNTTNITTSNFDCFAKDSLGNYFAVSIDGVIYKSENSGQTWNESATLGDSVHSIHVDVDNNLWIGTYTRGIYKSSDDGSNWVQLNNGLNHYKVKTTYKISSGELIAGTYLGGFYRSENNGMSWTESNAGFDNLYIQSVVVNSQNEIFASSLGSGVLFSSDSGNSWIKLDNGIGIDVIKLKINNQDEIFAGTLGNGLYKSTNSGMSWIKIKTVQSPMNSVRSIIFNQNNEVFISIDNEGIFYSSNDGYTWSDLDLKNAGKINTIKKTNDGIILAGTSTKGMYKSNDMGKTWISLNFPVNSVLSILVNERGSYFAGSSNGKIYKSTNKGLNWFEKSSLYYPVNELIESDEAVIYAALNHIGPYLSPDFGEQWGPFTNGIGRIDVYSLFIDNNDNLYAGSECGFYYMHKSYKALNKPLLISPENNSQNNFTNPKSNWYKQRDADYYEIQISDDINFENIIDQSDYIPSNFYQIKNLYENKNYFWRVRAVRDDSAGIWSDTWQFKTKLSSPTQISPINKSINLELENEITWDHVSDAQYYLIEISTSENFSDSSIVYISPKQSKTSYTFTGNHDIKYFWRVKAGNQSGESDWSDVWNFATLMQEPELIAPNDDEEDLFNSVVFSWKDYTNFTNYTLQISEYSDFANAAFNDSKIKLSTKEVTTLEFDKHYYWRLRVKFGDKLSYWSEVREFTTGYAPPTLISPNENSELSNYNINFTWNKYKDAIAYKFKLSDVKDFKKILIDTIVNKTSYIIDSLDKDNKYFWQISAVLIDKNSFPSEIRSFTTIKESNSLKVPTLDSPQNNSQEIDTALTFSWKTVPEANSYIFQLTDDIDFKYLIIDTIINNNQIHISKLNLNTQYHWKVKTINGTQQSNWSEIRSFKTKEGISVDGLIPQISYFEIFPNPGIYNVIISFNTSIDDFIEIQIYDVFGNQIKNIYHGHIHSGQNMFKWSSENDSGHEVPTGLYYIKISSNHFTKLKSLLIIR